MREAAAHSIVVPDRKAIAPASAATAIMDIEAFAPGRPGHLVAPD